MLENTSSSIGPCTVSSVCRYDVLSSTYIHSNQHSPTGDTGVVCMYHPLGILEWYVCTTHWGYWSGIYVPPTGDTGVVCMYHPLGILEWYVHTCGMFQEMWSTSPAFTSTCSGPSNRPATGAPGEVMTSTTGDTGPSPRPDSAITRN